MSDKKRKIEKIVNECDNNPEFLDYVYSKLRKSDHPINNIPDDLLIEIICFVPPNLGKKYSQVPEVCKRWNRLWKSERSRRARLRMFFSIMSIENRKFPEELTHVYYVAPLLFVFESMKNGGTRNFVIVHDENKTFSESGLGRNHEYILANRDKPCRIVTDLAYTNPFTKEHLTENIVSLWRQFLNTNLHDCRNVLENGFCIVISQETEGTEIGSRVGFENFLPYFGTHKTVTVWPTHDITRVRIYYHGLLSMVMDFLKEYNKEPSKYGDFESAMLLYQEYLSFC